MAVVCVPVVTYVAFRLFCHYLSHFYPLWCTGKALFLDYTTSYQRRCNVDETLSRRCVYLPGSLHLYVYIITDFVTGTLFKRLVHG